MGSGKDGAAAITAQAIVAKALEVGETMAGKPYTWGGKSLSGFDCSGYVSYVLKTLFPLHASQFNIDVAGYMTSDLFEDIAGPEKGCLIIFPVQAGYGVNHIGIVIDSTSWIGSQSSTGVKKVPFSNTWWGARTKKFRRIKAISTQSVSTGLASFGRMFA